MIAVKKENRPFLNIIRQTQAGQPGVFVDAHLPPCVTSRRRTSATCAVTITCAAHCDDGQMARLSAQSNDQGVCEEGKTLFQFLKDTLQSFQWNLSRDPSHNQKWYSVTCLGSSVLARVVPKLMLFIVRNIRKLQVLFQIVMSGEVHLRNDLGFWKSCVFVYLGRKIMWGTWESKSCRWHFCHFYHFGVQGRNC